MLLDIMADQTPPRREFKAQDPQSLLELDLAPSAMLYIKFDKADLNSMRASVFLSGMKLTSMDMSAFTRTQTAMHLPRFTPSCSSRFKSCQRLKKHLLLQSQATSAKIPPPTHPRSAKYPSGSTRRSARSRGMVKNRDRIVLYR